MIRTIITAITGGKREWRVVRWDFHGRPLFAAVRYVWSGDTIIRDRLTERAAFRLARRLRQQAEDRPEAVL